MSLLYVVLISAVVLSIAYRVYGGLLSRLLKLNPDEPTPAVKFRDDVDYAPIEAKFLLSQHFSAIAAAGPIVGPILAGVAFGWAPALIWILLGSIFIGGVHDMTSLVASIRHRASSIAEVVRDNMSRRSYLLFLAFIWIALVYIVVAFTDVTASSFVGMQVLENGDKIAGAEIASSSLMYLALPFLMGLLLKYTRLTIGWATVIFLPLVGLSIYAGQFVPLDLEKLLGVSEATAHKAWDVLLLVYCLGAAVVPMWLLLQPRGHLGGYFLYVALATGGIGLIIASVTGKQAIAYPAFTGWTSASGQTLFPFLFITIACGACSGFHSLIASGTTSKQLRVETDAKPIGYGSMLLEAMVAIISLSCVMILAKDNAALVKPKPNYIYALGMGNFLETLGIPVKFAVTFALMAFTTFVYDTLDVCTRLGRYILQELTGWRTGFGKWLATAATAGVPLFFVLRQPVGPDGKPVALWMIFWNLFGASNQLLAALTLLGVTVWLWRTRRAWWVWLVTGVPTVLIYVMSVWALVKIVIANLNSPQVPADGNLFAKMVAAGPVPVIAVILVALAILMLVEAVLVFAGKSSPPAPPATQRLPAGA